MVDIPFKVKIESGKDFKIVSYDKIFNCTFFRNLTLGVDPKLFTHNQIKKLFFKEIIILNLYRNNLVDEIKDHKSCQNGSPFFFIEQ
jgi:Xaa-Pro aminopeptidase